MSGEERSSVAFVLYPGLTPLDLVGPLQLLAGLATAQPSYDVTVVSERLEPCATDLPLLITAQRTFDDVPAPSVLVVPGGGAGTLRALGDQHLLEYVRTADATADVVASVCTGSLVLAAAGLLDGRKATTHWAFARFLERLGARYVPERWVEDGKYLCAAGVSAGIDMALVLGASLTDESQARQAQLFAEYDPRPPFGPIDWGSVKRDAMVPMIEDIVAANLPTGSDLARRLVPGR